MGLMTLCSLLLLGLKPQAREAPRAVAGWSSEPEAQLKRRLFATEEPTKPGRWRRIVIRFSGADRGSAYWLARRHQAQGRGSLGYHFVINNGSYRPDGSLEIGPRWDRQSPSAIDDHPSNDAPEATLAICLVGDGRRYPPTPAQMQRLLWLVRHLTQHLDIPLRHVHFQPAPRPTAQRTRQPLAQFPHDEFRQQLFAAADP
jgi:hypothetical protein